MDLNRAKELLNSAGIPFETVHYKCESDFWKHATLFSCSQKADSSKVIALVISSGNKHKDLELQFNESKDSYIFKELWFGDYTFEAFDYEPDALEQELLADIKIVMSGKFVAFVVYDLKNKRWLCDGIAEKTAGYAKSFERSMYKPKSWLDKIFRRKRQYELYDWNNYSVIIK